VSRAYSVAAMNASGRIVALASLLSACSVVPDADLNGVRAQAIFGGQPSASTAVVALAAQGHVYCSATLIGKLVIATAAHCLPPYAGAGRLELAEIAVSAGDDAAVPRAATSLVDSWTIEGYNALRSGPDIGLARLKNALGPAPAAFLGPDGAPPLAGEAATLVGFGMTSPSAFSTLGLQREAEVRIAEVLEDSLRFEDPARGLCEGDSGGAGFVRRAGLPVVASIHARSDCAHAAVATRLDRYASEIQAYLEASQPESPRGCALSPRGARASVAAQLVCALVVIGAWRITRARRGFRRAPPRAPERRSDTR